ncbi:MAG: DUF89 family protein [Candidatus Omnitrophica bacterium]|nr:DUF89 family protein [Candidatus Omnitrophota bacterium]MBU1047285.1 DUF89 family protein [Candidatus Omnitrophota bacterium]MBU1631163.1 DUF89 family protein [Candidatus Omnitrophota bacterium]MBU1889130.1 DUF89 family protein [Candidatus Omnitrophota bacterium]
MKTYLDCIPCFLKQTIELARITGVDDKLQKKIIDEVCKIIPEFSFEASPPQMAVKIHKIVRRLTSNKDPYKKIKQDSQKLGLDMYPYLKEQVAKADDALALAIKIAAIGNVIDFATNDFITIKKELKDITNHKFAVFDYEKFKDSLNNAKTILYLGDNAGETVFDKVLLEKISKDKRTYYAVRGFPTINDALEEDAIEAGIAHYAEIISNGSDAPGTFLNSCSKEFSDIFLNADLIISKGQGNFESLHGGNYPIFFIFMIKCPPVAKELNCKVGNLILKSGKE